MNNDELKKENKKFEEIKRVVSSIIEYNKQQILHDDEEISQIREYMLDNIELDWELGDIDIDAIRNGERIHDIKLHKDLLEIKNYKLSKIQNSPFFGRFRIRDNFGEEDFYIGLQNVQDKNDLFVVDWRAPIASLYYDSFIGKANYTVNNKIVQTNLILKRQFEIENGKIINYYDINNNLNDAYLNKILQGNTSNYMSNIVKSIQEEQNEIIRLPLSSSIILQGVAGSGKTSIAMHRIAYLLYANHGLTHQNILFITPSTIFSAYISHLLPELGEENVLCYSLFDVLTEQKLLNFKPTKSFDVLESVLNGNQTLQKQINKIYSTEYFDSLCNFLTEQIVIEDFEKLFPNLSSLIIKKLFYVGEDSYNLNKRIKFIAERFANYFGYKKTKTKILMEKFFKYFEYKINTDLLFEKFMNMQNLCVDKTQFQNISTYVFIKMCVEGYHEDKSILHIVVDEMQDYDFLTYKIFVMLYPKSSFTILGDIHQNLLTQSSNPLQKLQEIIKDAELQKLEVSYRSTANIFAYANKILGEKTTGRIIRQGDEPEEIECKSQKELGKIIEEKSKQANKKHQKIAIICKNAVDAKKFHKLFPSYDLLLSDTTITTLESKNILSTVYLCKGLEFDSVIIPISKHEFQNPQNKQLLYVAITRALHNVTICLF